MVFLTRFTPLLVLILTLTGCASDKALRPDLTTCRMTQSAADCGHHAVVVNAPQTDEEYQLGFVEFDDQGQARDRRQLETVFNGFREIAGTRDVLIVAFVHGWHHNAGARDENVAQFSSLLKRLAKTEAVGSHRKVLGLYLGWRGESVPLPFFRYLTFWERKSTAHKVGTNGAAEVFLKLEEIANVRAGLDQGENGPGDSRLVLIGHSFGGAVVFTALQQMLEDRFIDSRRGKTMSRTAKGFADLVVLVNPAFEALRYASLYDLSRERCSYFPQQLPKLALLTSEADWATGLAFPAGRFFSTLFETHNTVVREYCPSSKLWGQNLMYSEGQADRNTVGHFYPFLTHELHAVGEAGSAKSAEHRSYQELLRSWTKLQPAERLTLGDVELIHLGKIHPLNPYLNIRVDSALIPSHNDIWDERVVGFVRDLITLSTTPETAAK